MAGSFSGSRRRTVWRQRRFSSMSLEVEASQRQQETMSMCGRVKRPAMNRARCVRNLSSTASHHNAGLKRVPPFTVVTADGSVGMY